jgi:hypothetical protein
MSDNTLVAYATRAMTTAQGPEIARFAGSFSAVLGSAIRYSSWLCFLTWNRGAPIAMPVSVLSMHVLALDDDPARLAFCDRARIGDWADALAGVWPKGVL